MSASPTQALDPNAGLPAGFRPRRGLNWATVGLMYTSYYFCRYNFAYANKAIADEFGGDIPVGPFAIIGDDSIGRGIVETLRGHRSAAVLMRQHGVFTIGKDAKSALKAAIMCEDNAKSAFIAKQLGNPERVPQDTIDALFSRYQNVYGQTL